MVALLRFAILRLQAQPLCYYIQRTISKILREDRNKKHSLLRVIATGVETETAERLLLRRVRTAADKKNKNSIAPARTSPPGRG
jgi:hypothetical protein